MLLLLASLPVGTPQDAEWLCRRLLGKVYQRQSWPIGVIMLLDQEDEVALELLCNEPRYG